MAKITGALHSISATGALARTITFNKSGPRQTAKSWHKPTGEPSAAQTARRAIYKAGALEWSTMTAPEKAPFATRAALKQITAWNQFISEYLISAGTPTETTWDGGSTTWDSGTTIWIN